jgi:hypothetical protein
MEFSKKQIKAILKAEKLILEAEKLFIDAELGKNWCPIFGQTETVIVKAADYIKSYADYKLDRK